jgi:MinD-like ATPase involved in chromosome partitioning or flagellar assembly
MNSPIGSKGGVKKQMQKILLAVGFRPLEEFLERQLRKEFIFVGTTVYREGIIRAIGQKNPDIVVIRETLEGKENILKIVYEIRTKFPKVRIVFIAGKREPGDALLATLVNYGVYDILQGEKIRAQEVVALIRKPNEYKDVQHFQPVPILDEKRNEVLFEAPSPIIQEKEVIKEIYIDSGSSVPTEKESSSLQKVDTITIKDEDKEETVAPPPSQSEPSKPSKEKEPSKEKSKKSLFEKIISKSETMESVSPNNMPVTKQKIITFIGGKEGVGNSSIAFNTALVLAQKGLKTIYLELNDRTPTVSYWYELGHVDNGIDSALIALEKQQYEKVEKAIIRSSELKKTETESVMQKNYRKFPNTLDFMFFSNKYLTREREEELGNQVNLSLSKELFLYLMFHLNYDFIILDVPSDINHPVTSHALVYSNRVFVTLTQDVSTIGYFIYKLNALSKKGINLNEKIYYIINKFEKADFSLKEIEDWIQAENIITVPMLHKEFINANFLGLPILLYSKNSALKSSFQKIEKIMVEK